MLFGRRLRLGVAHQSQRWRSPLVCRPPADPSCCGTMAAPGRVRCAERRSVSAGDSPPMDAEICPCTPHSRRRRTGAVAAASQSRCVLKYHKSCTSVWMHYDGFVIINFPKIRDCLCLHENAVWYGDTGICHWKGGPSPRMVSNWLPRKGAVLAVTVRWKGSEGSKQTTHTTRKLTPC